MERSIENIMTRLKSKTGNYSMQGVKMEVVENGIRIEGRVYHRRCPYAQAQEKVQVHSTSYDLPSNGKVLAFMAATGDKVFATRVFHPGGQIPGQHFMKDAYRAMGPEISRGDQESVVEGIRSQHEAESMIVE
jgi:hypothetical protein